MGFRGNNVLHANHFRKDWQRRVRTWFDQPGRKQSRRTARASKAAITGVKPLTLVRPAVRCPTVKYNMKLRAGRGFSLAELKTAGVPKKAAKGLGIPVDHRRRNKSQEGLDLNVNRIKAYRSRLLVFPKNSKKPAKSDSSAEELKSQVCAITKSIFPIPAGIPHEAPRAITDAERSANAYATLRTARADKRHEGARKVRADKAAAEAEAKKK